jgi:succinylarginine dihydrolase
VAPTYFGLRPTSGSLQVSLAKVILILKHSVKLRRNFLCGGGAACLSMACVLCAVLCTAHNTHAILRHAATPPYNKLRHNFTERFNINITLARHNCKLPNDGRRPKHVGAN